MTGIAQLTGTVKHYDWGGTSFIPDLLNLQEPQSKPFAEFWMGVHPQANCQLQWADGSVTGLRDFIAQNLEGSLGSAVQARFGNMPYLFKALDVKDMLSIQVHPTKAAAETDFEAENSRGVPLDAPTRNYKDNNHKPELMVAMGDFWLLHGFRPVEAMKKILREIPELNFLLPVFESEGYAGLYKLVMEMPQEEVNAHLQPLLDRIVPLYNAGSLSKMHPDFWAARASITFGRPGIIDRGIFSVYLFNLVFTQKGDAVFQDAGVPHAYLEGQNIEIMASSDNVLRGGLTSKHIDVPELLRHVKCEATEPRILKGELHGFERVYKTPAPDFELSVLQLPAEQSTSLTSNTADILLLVAGDATLRQNDATVRLRKGQPAALLLPGRAANLHASADTTIFRASVPVDK